MSKYIKYACIYAGASAALALCVGPAFAVQNVANTSQKGSLLIFPLINVDTEDSVKYADRDFERSKHRGPCRVQLCEREKR